jgi:hypothetical protein
MTEAAVERLARNEALFREVNERIRNVATGDDGERYDFVCECANAGCAQRVSLTLAEYERVRANAVKFLIAAGHETPEVEHVVERDDDHLVVAKSGAAAEVARELDPRGAGPARGAHVPE